MTFECFLPGVYNHVTLGSLFSSEGFVTYQTPQIILLGWSLELHDIGPTWSQIKVILYSQYAHVCSKINPPKCIVLNTPNHYPLKLGSSECKQLTAHIQKLSFYMINSWLLFQCTMYSANSCKLLESFNLLLLVDIHPDIIYRHEENCSTVFSLNEHVL